MSKGVNQIKKEKQGFFHFWKMMTWPERLVVLVPLCITIILLIYIFVIRPVAETTVNPKATKEMLMYSDGSWQAFETYDASIWMPTEIKDVGVPEEYQDFMKLHATYHEKSKEPKRSVGFIVAPNVAGQVFDIQTDPSSVMAAINEYLCAGVEHLFNGTNAAISVDAELITLETGEPALEAFGEASLMCVYQTSSVDTTTYSEQVYSHFYYIAKVYEGRPVVAWGTWGYSELGGEEAVKEAVKDAITSIVLNDGKASLESWGVEEYFEDGIDSDVENSNQQDYGYPGAPDPRYYVTDEDGNFVYDEEGNLVLKDEYTYDEYGNIVSIDDVGTGSSDTGSSTIYIDKYGNIIDVYGNIIEEGVFEVDENGNVLDAGGNVINTWDPIPQETGSSEGDVEGGE